MNKWLGIIIIVLLGVISIMWKQAKTVSEKWKTAEGNVKAYANLASSAEGQVAALQLSVDQLEYFNDSVLQELDKTRKQLKVKGKNLKTLQFVTSSFIVNDTIVLKDTIFKDPEINIDTLIGDEWYNVRLGLKYPSTIAVKPYFKSEKHIIVSSKKETVNPPKKFFLFRLFQKKHQVLQVDVVEKNPYVENESSRYVEIIK